MTIMTMVKTLRRVVHQYTTMLAQTVAGPKVVGAGVILVVRGSLISVIRVYPDLCTRDSSISNKLASTAGLSRNKLSSTKI